MLRVNNPYLEKEQDYWYHLGFGPSDEVKKTFRDVKFVCMGGKNKRMEDYAKYLHQVLGKPQNSVYEEGTNELRNITKDAGRYCMYKVGNALSVSHGMGMPTFQILLNELFKLLSYAECEDVAFIRIGTSGGIGVEPGTTVITRKPYSSLLKPYFTQVACGKETDYDALCDEGLGLQLLECGKRLGKKVVIGNTMACNGFYEAEYGSAVEGTHLPENYALFMGIDYRPLNLTIFPAFHNTFGPKSEQGRLDGAMCTFTPEDKMEFLRKANSEYGILNVEMEAVMFGAMCRRFGVKCTAVCVAVVERLKGDRIKVLPEDYNRWENNPQEIVAELIRSHS